MIWPPKKSQQCRRNPKTRERKLLELMKKRRKPVCLFVDNAHDLHGNTLKQIKRLMELAQHQNDVFAVVLAGHPKITNDLRQPTMEEIGARATLLSLKGIQGQQAAFIAWLLEQCTAAPAGDIIAPEAITLLSESLVTPLQIEQYLTLALEAELSLLASQANSFHQNRATAEELLGLGADAVLADA